MSLVVTICAPLALDAGPVLTQVLADLGELVEIRHHPELLPPQRYRGDHQGEPGFQRTPDQQRQWVELLADTEVALGVPGDSPAGFRELAERAPKLRWVQGTAAGAGEQLAAAGLSPDQLSQLTVTSAAGVHAEPLAEFVLFGLLALAKDVDRLAELSRRREWAPRWPMRPLRGSHVTVLGLGGIGQEVCRLLAGFGVHVTAVRRTPGPPTDAPAEVVSFDRLDEVLPGSDAVVVTLPGTDETRGLLDSRRLALLPDHAVVVNVGRGSVVDSDDLADALDRGTLRGAVLDVADQEPLPEDSRLWGRDNVILSPHTAALATDEDERILELFGDNLRRFLRGEPLRNLVEHARGY